jgi:hypothetical protein
VKRSGLTLGAAGALTLPFAGSASAAAGIRKCLDLGPAADLNDPTTLFQTVASGTKWIRLWASWADAMPTPSGLRAGWEANLDEQIFIARAHGLNVVLVTWHFPTWANGTQNVPPDYMAADRAKPGGGLKELIYGVPADQLGVDGHWGHWIHYLIQKVAGYGAGVALEIMNEPNYQWWPQQTADGQISVGYKAAEMMQTAANINFFYGVPLLAPATSDTRGSSNPRSVTSYGNFLSALKGALQYLNFNGNANFRWSHHNYRDIETSTASGYTAAFNTLSGWWQGSKTGGQPAIWITEGGARMGSSEVNENLTTQANKVASAYAVMAAASGAAMFTNYLLHDPGDSPQQEAVDSALIALNGQPRPVWTTFLNMAGNP